jgi:hypothetical protein
LRALEQRPDRSYQLRTILNQLLGSRGEYIELGAADRKTEVLEQAADLVLEIGLDLDQQRTARQQRPDRVAVDILDGRRAITGEENRPPKLGGLS